MAAEFLHVCIPVLKKRPGMVYNEWGSFWISPSARNNDFRIAYQKFEEGTHLPEILSKQPHLTYRVDDLDPYLDKADRVLFGPEVINPRVRVAFIIHDDAILELYEEI